MKRVILSLAFIWAGFAAIGDAALAQGVSGGQTLQREITIAGKSAPLPPGEWVVAGVGPGVLKDGAAPGPYGLIWNVVLLRPTQDKRAIDAMMELNVNDLGVSDGWGVSASCSRKDFPLAVVRYKAGWDASCFFLTHSLWTWRKPVTRAWEDAMRYAAARSWTLPSATVTSGFRVANRRDVMDARFHFTTAFHGIQEPPLADWSQSAWHATRIEKDERRINFAKALTEWTVLASGYMEAGLKQRLPEAPLPNPGVDAETLARDSIARQRLATLEGLRKGGLISDANFEDQARVLAEKGIDPTSVAIDPATIALYKTLAYRPTVSVANIFIDYYWIGQPFATGVLLLLQVTINSVKFYFHELAWDKFVGGGQRRDSARTLDFAYEPVDG